MIEWIAGQWYHVHKRLHFYVDYTWQWQRFREAYTTLVINSQSPKFFSGTIFRWKKPNAEDIIIE